MQSHFGMQQTTQNSPQLPGKVKSCTNTGVHEYINCSNMYEQTFPENEQNEWLKWIMLI